ncbi:MAG: hypothetical protein ACK4WH_04650 [Phycisphaerales bacterium]
MKRLHAALAIAALATSEVGTVLSASDPAGMSADPAVVTVTNLGIEGRVLYRYPAELRARAFDPKSPVAIRIVTSVPGDSDYSHDIRFILSKPGRYDLREWLERADRGSMDDAPAATVQGVGVLPDDHSGELHASPGLGMPSFGRYRLALAAFGVLWLVPPAVWLARRLGRRRELPLHVQTELPPALADQMRPIVDAVISGTAGVEEKARLERLLFAYWRDKLALSGLPAQEAAQRLRCHPEGGELIRSIESWLHRPKMAGSAALDLAALLEPYRQAQRTDPVPTVVGDTAATGEGKHPTTRGGGA